MRRPSRHPERLVLTLDIGTTTAKGSLFDYSGNVIDQQRSQIVPVANSNGNFEFDSNDWWRIAKSITRKLVHNISPKSVESVAVTGQMTSPVWLDRTKVPLRSVISYLDERTTTSMSRSGVSSGELDYSASKLYPILTWLRTSEPRIAERISYALDVKEFIGFKLSGKITHEPEWETKNEVIGMANRFNVPKDWFGEVHPEVGIMGQVTEKASRETGLAKGTPVLVGPGDGICAITGCGVLEPSTATDVAGTTDIVACVSTERNKDYSVRHCVPGYWINYKFKPLGNALDWFARVIGSYKKLEGTAKKATGQDRPCFMPDMENGGVFFGLRPSHKMGDMARAVYEGVCFEVRGLVEAQEKEGHQISKIVIGGGGARSDYWNGLRADVTGKTLVRSHVVEVTSLGMAIISGVALRHFTDLPKAMKRMARPSAIFEPDPSASGSYSHLYDRYRIVTTLFRGNQAAYYPMVHQQ